MPFNTTALAVSTTPAAVISTGTTWAHIRGGHMYDLVPLSIYNDGAVSVWIGGSSGMTSASGFPILSSGVFSAQLLASDPIFAVTTGSTSTLRLIAGRQ